MRQRDLGHIVIEPFTSTSVNPNSYNYTLSQHVSRLANDVIDLRGIDKYENVVLSQEGTRLEPGELYLGATRETFGSALFASLITGRSSIGRKFVTNHVTAGLVDVGFVGQITLEIVVQRPTIVYPGVPFGQIYWFTLAGAPVQYAGKYQGQRLPTASRLAFDHWSGRDGRGRIREPGGGSKIPTEVIFEAHATSVDNEGGVASGHADVSLSALGEEQAGDLGLRYDSVQLDAVYCSDLQRSHRTAEIAFAGRPLHITRDARLRECDYGVLTRAAGSDVAAVKREHVVTPFPDGESYVDCAARVRAVLKEIAREYPGGTVLVVGHRATQYALEHWLRGLDLEEAVSAAWEWQPGWTYVLTPGQI